MIPLPQKPKIIETKKNSVVFEIEDLYPGYGVTIGNSLRRVLLSSLEGAAITRVKIKGVQHEFSTLSGVLEDVLQICQNLKLLRFKVYTDEPQQAFLKIKGEKEVKAGDFELPSQVELINKDAHLATITSKSTSLEMEIQIEKGVGYVPVELRGKEKLGVGEICLDAIFTPIKTVAFHVENMRVGDRTDFNRLKIEIETDGTITPQEALSRAAKILVEHFSLIPEEEKKEKEGRKSIGKKDENVLETKIEDLKLSTRTINALSANKIKTVGGILKRKLSEIEGLGEKGIKEIKKVLKKLNIELETEEK
ncbi:MAG: DNA-directed RNA polymerase subunit alpha [Candidatus Nealsonbacteria bacterium]|nr:DNA-directed RNA polymerase subunit alpha [Candidatus Nealsonbacteria bacterium]